MKFPCTIILLFVLLLKPGVLSGQEPKQGSLKDLIQQMQSHPERNFSQFIGKIFIVDGPMNKEGTNQQNVRLEIWVLDAAKGRQMDSGIACNIIVGDTSKILQLKSDSISVRSTGILQSVDPKTKTITIKSDDKKTYIIAAN